MTNFDIANGIVFNKMSISKETFEDRIIAQKKVFLLQALGTDLGYTYNWYLRGPYSPALTQYMYSNIDFLRNMSYEDYRVSETVLQNIEKVNQLRNERPAEISEHSWYELLASLLYIDKNREGWKIESGNDALFNELVKQKPQFNQVQCENAFRFLTDKGFTS